MWKLHNERNEKRERKLWQLSLNIIFKRFIFFPLYDCVFVCIHVYADAYEGFKKESYPLELEIQVERDLPG